LFCTPGLQKHRTAIPSGEISSGKKSGFTCAKIVCAKHKKVAKIEIFIKE